MTPYEVITEAIIKKVEEGNLLPWNKPWRSGRAGFPKNLVSGKEYRGTNLFILHMAPYDSPYFLTYKQAQDRGGNVKKGEHGWPVIYWKFFDPDPVTKKTRPPICRFYKVWNVEQCEGIDYPSVDPIELANHDQIAACERVVSSYKGRPEIKDATRAYYQPSTDSIHMPVIGKFEKPEHYYAILFHEMTHSSGHEKRLARKGITDNTMFGSHEYSKEELVAEFGAAFLCGVAGIEQVTIENHASYIKSWLKRLKEDKKMLVEAAQAAQRAMDHILGENYNEQVEEEAA